MLVAGMLPSHCTLVEIHKFFGGVQHVAPCEHSDGYVESHVLIRVIGRVELSLYSVRHADGQMDATALNRPTSIPRAYLPSAEQRLSCTDLLLSMRGAGCIKPAQGMRGTVLAPVPSAGRALALPGQNKAAC